MKVGDFMEANKYKKVNVYKKEIVKEIKNCCFEKQLNILIGSGCSSSSMPLMSKYSGLPKDEANDRLLEDIIRLSKLFFYKLSSKRYKVVEKFENTQINYVKFMSVILEILNKSNARQSPRAVNIFTTNYDLFIEDAISQIQINNRLVFNDGASGYFERVLDSTNYNKVVAFKGLNDNYISEIPSINLIKTHGSVNWEMKGEKVHILNSISNAPVVVKPTGYESQDTVVNSHFHEMLRVFQLELDKPQSVLLVMGFSFQDKHFVKLLRRAVQNSELIIYLFIYSGDGKDISNNLGYTETTPPNLKIITPDKIFSKEFMEYCSVAGETSRLTITIEEVAEMLNQPEKEIETEDEVENDEC